MNPNGNPATLKKFSDTYRPKNPGRKPNHLKKYLKENNIGTTDIRHMVGGLLVSYKTHAELRAATDDPKTPPFVKYILKAMLQDYLKGTTFTIQFLMRYAYGEPKQEIETHNVDDITLMTPAQRLEMEKELIRELVKQNKDQIKEILDEQENVPD